MGRDRDPEEFGPQPANVHIERYIPQSLILPLCTVVVSHCGSGTMRAALDAGLPLVNLPIAADQPENAARCDALGVSRTVQAREYTPGTIRAAVRAVPAEPRYRARPGDARRYTRYAGPGACCGAAGTAGARAATNSEQRLPGVNNRRAALAFSPLTAAAAGPPLAPLPCHQQSNTDQQMSLRNR